MKQSDFIAIRNTMRQIESGEDPTLDSFAFFKTENRTLSNAMVYGPQLPSLTDATEAIQILRAHVAQFKDAPEMIGEVNHLFQRERHGEFARYPKRPPPPKRVGCIYLAVSRSHSRTKIGFSAEPDARLSALKNIDPEISFHFVSEPRFTLKDERNLHERFAAQRHHREWFTLEQSHVETITSLLSKLEALK